MVNHMVLFLGMGCFWEPEKLLNSMHQTWTTEVGYVTCPNSNIEIEVIKVLFDCQDINEVLSFFWENHYAAQDDDFPVPPRYRSILVTEHKELVPLLETSALLKSRSLGKNVRTLVFSSPKYSQAEKKHQKRYLSH